MNTAEDAIHRYIRTEELGGTEDEFHDAFNSQPKTPGELHAIPVATKKAGTSPGGGGHRGYHIGGVILYIWYEDGNSIEISQAWDVLMRCLGEGVPSQTLLSHQMWWQAYG